MFTASKVLRIGRISTDLSISKQLLMHAALGVVIVCAVLAGLLIFNVGSLWALLWQAEEAAMLLSVVALQFGVGFATFSVATGVFMLRRRAND